MMTYEMFKEVVIKNFKNYLTKECQDMDMQVKPVKKVNCTLDGITLTGGAEGRRVLPTIYINHMYNYYIECNDLQRVLQDAAIMMEEKMQEQSQIPMFDYENARNNIVFQLINTEQNSEMLQNMPHREFQDLSIIYNWVVDIEADRMQCMKVNNEMAEMLDISEEELFTLAEENTRRILPPCVISINEVLRDMGMLVDEMIPEVSMWVITNDRRVEGAASLLYEDKLQELAQEIGTDLYILPSSVHEVLAVPANKGESENLAQTVFEVNMTQVELEERLSNQVYHYDKDLRKLTLATDTPNKNLTGTVEESSRIYETKQIR